MSSIEKPQLRGLHMSQIKRRLVGILIASTAAAVMYKIFVADVRKQKYIDFYKYVYLKNLQLCVVDVFKILLFFILISS